MAKKLEIRPSKANRPRNAFDLSQNHMFTAPVGALLPILTLDLIPHDHIEINAQDFMRTMPMNTSAFVSMRGVYEFFFVPYSQLWHQFDQFITGMNDYKTAYLFNRYNKKYPVTIPAFNRKEIFDFIWKSTDKDMFNFPKKDACIRLLDLLGYGYPVINKGDVANVKGYLPSSYQGKITPLRFAAYNKIYSDFYRNTQYEGIDVHSFNFDELNVDELTSQQRPKLFYDRFMRLHYRNAPLDYFTNLRPTPLFEMQDGITGALQKSFSVQNTFGVDPANTTSFVDVDQQGTNNTRIPVAALRSAFALDKLLSISMRAGKTYAEQIEAHFGVRVSEGRDGQVYYLGGFQSDYSTTDVTQTSGTTDPKVSSVAEASLAGYLGKIAGKGTSSGKGHISFDAKEHGMLMCIYSVVPAMQYDSSRVDPFVTKQQRGDFFVPEFENLGMQPLMSEHIFDLNRLPQTRVPGAGPAVSAPFGWQLRYSEYKTALDINHGQFAGDGPLSFWSIGRGRAFDESLVKGKLTLSQLKISPHWVDSVFAVDYNGTELTDQFFGHCYFQIQKVSDMSVDGMPRV